MGEENNTPLSIENIHDVASFLNELDSFLKFANETDVELLGTNEFIKLLMTSYPNVKFDLENSATKIVDAMFKKIERDFRKNLNSFSIIPGKNCVLECTIESNIVEDNILFLDFFESILHSCEYKTSYQPFVLIPDKESAYNDINPIMCDGECSELYCEAIQHLTLNQIKEHMTQNRLDYSNKITTDSELENLIELKISSEERLFGHPSKSSTAIPLKITHTFRKSANLKCNKILFDSLLESLSKLSYSIKDKSLGDEPFEDHRRCRATDFWRIHYEDKGAYYLLTKFGPHDMGINSH